MIIKEFQVINLFGMFDHTIKLNHSDRISIIHGPNGIGKTIMLKMIEGFIIGDPDIFKKIPFDEFRVFLKNGSVIIKPKSTSIKTKDNINTKELVAVVNNGNNKQEKTISFDFGQDWSESFLDDIDSNIPGPYQRFRRGWIDDTGNYFTPKEIFSKFPHIADLIPPKYRINSFSEILKNLAVFFIQTNRLDAENSFRKDQISSNTHLNRINRFTIGEIEDQGKLALRVYQYSQDIVHRIKSTLADYAKHSQESDRTFPERLVGFLRNKRKALPIKEIITRMTELETKRKRLISLGFLDSEKGLSDLTEEDVSRAPEALTIYVYDVEEKLAVFDDLSRRVGKLMDILNERYDYKSITLNRERGFRIQTDNGKILNIEDLSSGEQHELIVLYELLFRTPKNGLILIDEPEISLHVAWQSRFLKDLADILELNDSYGIVATHSPTIIGSRWDLTEVLRGPNKGEGLQWKNSLR